MHRVFLCSWFMATCWHPKGWRKVKQDKTKEEVFSDKKSVHTGLELFKYTVFVWLVLVCYFHPEVFKEHPFPHLVWTTNQNHNENAVTILATSGASRLMQLVLLHTFCSNPHVLAHTDSFAYQCYGYPARPLSSLYLLTDYTDGLSGLNMICPCSPVFSRAPFTHLYTFLSFECWCLHKTTRRNNLFSFPFCK